MADLSVPYLRSGTGDTPRDGGCVMQIVDWITRHEWTDAPPCVHPALRRLAIHANDTLDDADRQTLLDLVPRLMNTATGEQRVSVGLAAWCARQVLPLYEARYPGDLHPRRAIEAAERGEGTASAYSAASAAAASAYAAASDAAAHAAASAYAAYAAAYAASDAAVAARAAAYAAADAVAAADAITPIALLRGALDEYDRLAGRTTVPPVDFREVCAVMRGGPARTSRRKRAPRGANP